MTAPGSGASARPLAPALSSRRIAFHGARGAFGEDAIAALWPDDAAPVPMRTALAVVRAASRGAVDAGVVPVANVIAGHVEASCVALARCTAAHVVGEAVIDIRLALLAPPGATLAGLEAVESHPMALAQCTRFLARHAHLRVRAAWNTAGAARDVAASGDARRGAIAGRAAGARYGLAVLAEGIEDGAGNRTRFLAVARAPVQLPAGTPARTSIIVETTGRPDALDRLLGRLGGHGLKASAPAVRPPNAPLARRHLVEFGHLAGDPVREAALAAVRADAEVGAVRVLGTYARAREEA